MERLLLFATHEEAAETICQLDANPIGRDLFCFWGGKIAITGMGIHLAQAFASAHLHAFDECWNLGLAGAIDKSLPLMSVVSIKKVLKHIPSVLDSHSLELTKRHLPAIDLDGDYILATSDFPIHDKNKQPKNTHLVDMEGYGIAFAAKYLNKPLRMWKVVSDFAEEGGAKLIQENIRKGSLLLARRVMEEVQK